MFQNGHLTVDQWVAFCRDYFDNIIMADPDIIGVMTRLRDRVEDERH